VTGIKVCTTKFESLSKNKRTLTIPDFQRSYVWSEKNLSKLLNNLKQNNQNKYYMGTILLYKRTKNEYEIIDGQQRITTLVILDYIVNGKNNNLLSNLTFSSQTSINHIIRAKKYFEENKNCMQGSVLKKVIFTVIITPSQDEAFTFFDTQNSRGVKLDVSDLLKAHHLREINDINKQTIAAKKWEQIGSKKGVIYQNKEFLSELFKYILYRARAWRGSRADIVKIEDSDRIQDEKIKEEFEKGTKDIIRFYPHNTNMLVHSIDINSHQEYTLKFEEKQFTCSPKNIPFSLRQPISKGLGFFLFVEKYAQIVDDLNTSKDYDKVINCSSFSRYLKELFILCTVCYYDKFKTEKLYEFSLWLEYFLGAVRLEQYSVREATIPKILRDEFPINIIDVILGSFTPEEVIEYLKSLQLYNGKKLDYIYANFDCKKSSGVKEKYCNCILQYYNKDESSNLKDKRKWINESTNGEK